MSDRRRPSNTGASAPTREPAPPPRAKDANLSRPPGRLKNVARTGGTSRNIPRDG
jgi:hypothetical protein